MFPGTGPHPVLALAAAGCFYYRIATVKLDVDGLSLAPAGVAADSAGIGALAGATASTRQRLGAANGGTVPALPRLPDSRTISTSSGMETPFARTDEAGPERHRRCRAGGTPIFLQQGCTITPGAWYGAH
jgi:hypothetical protein